ncbi:claudin-19-like [Eucyclogobius newberryi]|uniref:claudin-19-like n=1 Tax=Eucyclogobius newberryi TaxID=166745 RepID=UPI003B58B99D
MIIALLLGLGAMVVALLGLKCIKIGSSTEQSKAKLAATGGILSMLGGLCTLTAASWYAHRVIQEFYDPFLGGIRFELGSGLYLCWGGAALALLGGALLCTACKRAGSQKTGSVAAP